MTVADLIIIACLHLNGDGSCVQDLTNCANSKQVAISQEHNKSCKKEKLSFEDCDNKRPQVEWSHLILECTKARKK